MTSVPKSHELTFIRNYYQQLCNRPSAIQQYYTENSQLIIVKEDEEAFESCTEEFGKYIQEKISTIPVKILISQISYQKIEDIKSLINVIGQFVYSDNKQSRFTHQFVLLKVESILYIQNEILTFLNEEVVYEDSTEKNRKVTVEYGSKKFSEAVNYILGLVNVNLLEKRKNKSIAFVVEEEKDMEVLKKNASKMASLGYKIDFN